MTVQTIKAQITSDGPLQGAELIIQSDGYGISVDVHLDAIGRHPARWVPIQIVDAYLDGLPDLETCSWPGCQIAASIDDRCIGHRREDAA